MASSECTAVDGIYRQKLYGLKFFTGFFIMRITSYKMEIISSAHASQYDMNRMEKEQQQRYRQTNGHKYCNLTIYFSHEKSFISIEFHDCLHSRTRTLHSLSLGQINHEYLNWRSLLLDVSYCGGIYNIFVWLS